MSLGIRPVEGERVAITHDHYCGPNIFIQLFCSHMLTSGLQCLRRVGPYTLRSLEAASIEVLRFRRTRFSTCRTYSSGYVFRLHLF